MKDTRSLDGAELGLHRSSRLSVFLTYVPVLIFALSAVLWIWLLQSTANKDAGAIQLRPYSMGGELIRIKIRADELQRLNVESKVTKALLEERSSPVGKKIDILVTSAYSADMGLTSKPSENKLHSGNKTYYHIVQAGETSYRIARMYGLTVQQLVTINDLADPKRIYLGQKILISGDQGIDTSRLN